MPSDDQIAGGFPGLPDRDAWGGLRAAVQRQVTELAQLRHEPAVRHLLLRQLQDRRQPPERFQPPPGLERYAQVAAGEAAYGGGDEPVTQFGYLPVKEGFDTLLASNELLITGRSYDGRHPAGERSSRGETAKRYLEALGFEEAEPGCRQLENRVVRLAHPGGASAEELAEVARNLRTRGFSAAVTYITPTAPVGKGTPCAPLQGTPPRGTGSGGAGGGEAPEVRLRSTGTEPAGQAAAADTTQVAVIDTGIWSERLGTVLPGSQLDHLHEFPLGAPRSVRDEYLDLDAGHGTFVTGIVQQVAPSAGVRVYRAVDGDGIGTELAVACAMIKAVEEGAQILNLSLGCQSEDDFPPVALRAALDVIRNWERDTGREVLVVAAAGNCGDTRPFWPAAFRDVVSVAGLGPDLLPSQWSSHGFWVTCSAIGQGILSNFVAGRESPLETPTPVEFSRDPEPWAVWSGTSFAAPQITGVLARLYQPGGPRSLRDVLRELLESGNPVSGFGQALQILPGL
jgi:subtilisin family serine protease